MPYIQSNMLLTPTEKLIKPYECSFIAIEGPNLKGKIDLQGLEIKYESFYVSQLILNEKAKDQPIVYGFLGENITFLLIRAKYLPLDPNWAIETEQYIQYYYADDPARIRTMGQLQILTGNSTNRIPQLFFNNPSSIYKVYIEILAANLAQSDITVQQTGHYTPTSIFGSLYHNSIISDEVNYVMPYSVGSSELQILDSTGSTVMVIPYTNIRTISKTGENILTIGLDTEEKVKLDFLTEFYCNQANSRINWVLNDYKNRKLTLNEPSVDDQHPVYQMNIDLPIDYITGITSGSTLVYTYDLVSGSTLNGMDLINYFISGVTDNMDGIINKENVIPTIFIINDLVPINFISQPGLYNIYFQVKDLAANVNGMQLYMSIEWT